MKLLVVLLCCLLSGCAIARDINPDPLPQKDSLNILCLNMKGFDVHSQSARMAPIVDIVNNEGIDVLLLQEGTLGFFGGDSIGVLQKKLNYTFDCYKESSFGIKSIYEYQIGILSRFNLTEKRTVPSVVIGEDQYFIGAKRIVSSRVDIDGIGSVYLVTLHFHSSTIKSVNEDQFKQLVDYLAAFDQSSLTIVAGDFNAPIATVQSYLYPLGFNLIIGNGVDSIWVKNGTGTGKVVFSDHFVSDHSGLVAEIRANTPYN